MIEKLRHKIFESNRFVESYKEKFISKFGNELGLELLSSHFIKQIREIENSNPILFWNSFDFSKLNFFSLSFFKSEDDENGYVIGLISGDFFILNYHNEIVITKDLNIPILDFEEFVEFITILIKLSLLNYTDQLSSNSFGEYLFELKKNKAYRDFINCYFGAMLLENNQ